MIFKNNTYYNNIYIAIYFIIIIFYFLFFIFYFLIHNIFMLLDQFLMKEKQNVRIIVKDQEFYIVN